MTSSAPKALSGRLHVDHLAADHAVAAGGFGQARDQGAAHLGGRMGVAHRPESRTRWSAAHRRPAPRSPRRRRCGWWAGRAADRRRPCRADRHAPANRCAAPRSPRRTRRPRAIVDPEQPARVQHQERPQPLAAGEDGIAHGLVDARLCRPCGLGRTASSVASTALALAAMAAAQAGVGLCRRRIAPCLDIAPCSLMSGLAPEAASARL